MSNLCCWDDYQTGPQLTGNQGQRFPLMRLPAETRNLIYRHALDHALPNDILPRWMQHWHEYTTGQPITTGRSPASTFINLQLSNRQVYQEASHILYQDRHFCFIVAPRHASFLDGCILPGHSPPPTGVQDKSYTHRITNIVLRANWDGYDGAEIRDFSWTDWQDVAAAVCRELLRGFSGLRKLTLDWRAPNASGGLLEPSAEQWARIAPSFERLRARRPEIEMEVLLAWQAMPGRLSFEHGREFGRYTRELLLQQATAERHRQQTTSSSLPHPRNSDHQPPPPLILLPDPRYTSQIQQPPLALAPFLLPDPSRPARNSQSPIPTSRPSRIMRDGI